jgi:transcription antitermination factor NusG
MLQPRAIPDDRMWFAVQTWPRHEKKVAAALQQKEIEAFLPLSSKVHQWSDRRCVIELPLFPTYLFVRLPWTAEARIPILRTNAVQQIVGSNGVGSPIPESEIDSVRRLLRQGVDFQTIPYLNTGQRVRIRGSSLDGIEGVLVAKNDDLSLVVSINILQRSLAIRVAGYQVEAA